MDFLQAALLYTHKSVNDILCKNCTYIKGNISLGGEIRISLIYFGPNVEYHIVYGTVKVE
jgi:hypothetical protein